MPVAAACAVVFAVLGVVFAGERTPGAVDGAVANTIEGLADGLLRVFVLPTEPPVLLAVLGVLVAVTVWRRDRAALALVVAAPAVAVSVNTWVLKPAFGRVYDDHLAYPSGHTVSLVAVLTVLAVLARPGPPRAATVVTGVVLTALAGIGMVGLEYHYLSDVLGGAAFAVAATLGLAALVGASARHRRGGGVAGERGEPADRA
ncbi:phosphatase PAP2 family protein [Prauserella sp. ASG 168]|uniref:Phosphatase PAP2 family protein n=1 Tax=Prauserella cavernicola TaxID=2800127 RepID=A0A934V8Y9_9PSEU|nr:phosphatase PAP2 family protein [Prauserella cavernicola]